MRPKSLRKQMLNKAHEGHLGVAKSYKARAREHMCWPGMSRAIDDMIVRCEVCSIQTPTKKGAVNAHTVI